jgi:hypothetical protein
LIRQEKAVEEEEVAESSEDKFIRLEAEVTQIIPGGR